MKNKRPIIQRWHVRLTLVVLVVVTIYLMRKMWNGG